MDYRHPLITRITAQTKGYDATKNQLYIPMDRSDKDVTSYIQSIMKDVPEETDYAFLHIQSQLPVTKDSVGSLHHLSSVIAHELSRHNLQTYTSAGPSKPFYRLSKIYSEGHAYAMEDQTVKERMVEVGFDLDTGEGVEKWQAYQSRALTKVGCLFPLNDIHTQELTHPKRGLSEDDLWDMYSWKSNEVINPILMKEDFVGIPGFRVKQTNDIFYLNGKEIGRNPLAIMTTGLDGFTIPMRSVERHMPKFQLGADISVINNTLKARTSDGTTIRNSEIFNKDCKPYGEYLFSLRGEPSHLRPKSTINNQQVVFEDILGEFSHEVKKDIKPVLLDRGYDIPKIIDSLTLLPSAKYIWTSPGAMVGSKHLQKYSTPSVAGYIHTGRTPDTHHEISDDHTLLIVEGALKGRIVAKYLHNKDENGMSLKEFISPEDHAVTVVQVPGVARAFIESVRDSYDKLPVKRIVIAMDADGATNKNVCTGIHQSVDVLSEDGITIEVMSWDPHHKGLDDLLISVDKKELTLDEARLKLGSAEELFPLDAAKYPYPVYLNGVISPKTEWQQEYEARKKEMGKQHTEAVFMSKPLTYEDSLSANEQLSLKVSEHIGFLEAVEDRLPDILQSNPSLETSSTVVKTSLEKALNELSKSESMQR